MFKRSVPAGLLLVTALLASSSLRAFVVDCGDVDGSGQVTTGDALQVLRKSVGLDVGYTCEPPSTTTTSNTIDECFDDEDCQIYVDPDWHCMGYTCVRCRNDEHCGSQSVCERFECVPAGQSSCDDVDGNAKVNVVDALMVLNKSVGIDVAFQCILQSTTTTTEGTIGDCFSDLDCEFKEGKPHCCDGPNVCAECNDDENCGDGQYCNSNCECVPSQ